MKKIFFSLFLLSMLISAQVEVEDLHYTQIVHENGHYDLIITYKFPKNVDISGYYLKICWGIYEKCSMEGETITIHLKDVNDSSIKCIKSNNAISNNSKYFITVSSIPGPYITNLINEHPAAYKENHSMIEEIRFKDDMNLIRYAAFSSMFKKMEYTIVAPNNIKIAEPTKAIVNKSENAVTFDLLKVIKLRKNIGVMSSSGEEGNFCCIPTFILLIIPISLYLKY